MHKLHLLQRGRQVVPCYLMCYQNMMFSQRKLNPVYFLYTITESHSYTEYNFSLCLTS